MAKKVQAFIQKPGNRQPQRLETWRNPAGRPALIGPACMGSLAGIISCRHHKAAAAPGRATTHEPCPAHGAPEEGVQAGLDISTTEPGRRRGPVWRPAQGFQRTTHQRLMKGGRDVPAELVGRLNRQGPMMVLWYQGMAGKWEASRGSVNPCFGRHMEK